MIARVRRHPVREKLPGPHEDAEVQEAMARRYSLSSMPVMKLSTGRWALFSRRFELLTIGSWSEIGQRYEEEHNDD